MVILSITVRNPANTRRRANVVLMLGQRRRRWPNISTTLGQRLVFAGKSDVNPLPASDTMSCTCSTLYSCSSTINSCWLSISSVLATSSAEPVVVLSIVTEHCWLPAEFWL